MSTHPQGRDGGKVIWLRHRGSALRLVLRWVPLMVPLVTLLLIVPMRLVTERFAPGSSWWWTLPPAFACAWLLPLALWIQAARNLRSMRLGLSDEGFIYRVPISHTGGEAHIAFDDITGFGRAARDDEIYQHRCWLDRSRMAPVHRGKGSGEALALLGDAWVLRPRTSLMVLVFRLSTRERAQGVWFRPEAFDPDWRDGAIGRALRERRPDLPIPKGGDPLPLVVDPTPRE